MKRFTVLCGPEAATVLFVLYLVASYPAFPEGSVESARDLPLATATEWGNAKIISRDLAAYDIINSLSMFDVRYLMVSSRAISVPVDAVRAIELRKCIDRLASEYPESVVLAIALVCIDSEHYDLKEIPNTPEKAYSVWKGKPLRSREIGLYRRWVEEHTRSESDCCLHSRFPQIPLEAATVAPFLLRECMYANHSRSKAIVEQIGRACWSWLCNSRNDWKAFGPVYN